MMGKALDLISFALHRFWFWLTFFILSWNKSGQETLGVDGFLTIGSMDGWPGSPPNP
jgi:hypothetical protein